MLVRSYDVGSAGVLKPQAIFQFFQEAAGNHATDLGVGYEALQALGLVWVLSRVKVEIAALPAWGDEVMLTTWPKGTDRLFALRDFRMSDRAGNILVRGTSCWLLVGVKSLRPRRIESLGRSFPLNETDHAIQESLDRIPVPNGLQVRYERRVMTSDLDVNNHVNNTEYVRWIADCLGTDSGVVRPFRSMQVNYLEEAKLGETIAFSIGNERDHPTTLFVEGTNSSKHSKVVHSVVEMTP